VSGAPRSTAQLVAIASVGIVALTGTGCGDGGNTEVTIPTISVETTQSVATQTSSTETTPTEPQNGGTGTIDPNAPDSAKNDRPPEPGSPEEAFENACKQNPDACR
jgi:hypothetical protein